MRRTILVTTLFATAVLALSSSAHAQSAAPQAYARHGVGPGVGGVAMLNGASGGLFTYGTARWHVDALFGLQHVASNTNFNLGGRFWWHVHSAAFSDFSLGGGLGILRWENDGNGDDQLDVALQIGAQMRVFIVPNVALLGDLGVGAYFGGDDNIVIGAQSFGGGANFLQGTVGIAYFFE